MTRKDYEAIAAAIRTAYAEIDTDYQQNTKDNMRHGVNLAYLAIADALAQDNPRFDIDRFINACTEG